MARARPGWPKDRSREKAAAWLINLAVAEWAIRRGATQRPRRMAVAVRDGVPA